MSEGRVRDWQELEDRLKYVEREQRGLHALYKEEADKLRALLGQAKEMLRQVEWECHLNKYFGNMGYGCFFCRRKQSRGHAPNCEWVALMGRPLLEVEGPTAPSPAVSSESSSS